MHDRMIRIIDYREHPLETPADWYDHGYRQGSEDERTRCEQAQGATASESAQGAKATEPAQDSDDATYALALVVTTGCGVIVGLVIGLVIGLSLNLMTVGERIAHLGAVLR